MEHIKEKAVVAGIAFIAGAIISQASVAVMTIRNRKKTQKLLEELNQFGTKVNDADTDESINN